MKTTPEWITETAEWAAAEVLKGSIKTTQLTLWLKWAHRRVAK